MKYALQGVARVIAHRLVYPAAEGLWTVCFFLAGALLNTKLRAIAPTGKDMVLVVAPHPDDETLGCGLAIVEHVRSGDNVCVAVVTDGRRSRAGGLDPAEMRRRRRDEARYAVAALGAQCVLLDLPEGAWQEGDFVTALSPVLGSLDPTIIYAPSTIDYHPEHKRVARSLAGVISRHGRQLREVRLYQVQVPLGPFLADAYVPSNDLSRKRKREALARYISQRASFDWLTRRERYDARLYRLPGAAEVFTCTDPHAYGALVTAASSGRFRGLRPRPLSDPLAWMVGLGHRVHAIRAARRRWPRN